MTVDVVNTKNQKVGSVDLNDALFGKRVHADLIWESVVHEQAENRRGTQRAKTRGEVQGSGRKLWKQKGTGRARVSDLRNPIWRKGGVVFAPQPRDYSFALPKKVRKGALREALAFQVQAGVVTIVDSLAIRAVRAEGSGGGGGSVSPSFRSTRAPTRPMAMQQRTASQYARKSETLG